MRTSLSLCAFCLFLVGCMEPIEKAPSSSSSQSASTASSNSGSGPVKLDTKRSDTAAIDPYKGKQPVLIVMGNNRDAFMQKLTEAEAELQAKNVVVFEFYDLDRAYPQGGRWKGEKTDSQNARNMVDLYGMGPSGTLLVLLDAEGNTVHRGKEDLSVSELLAKLPE